MGSPRSIDGEEFQGLSSGLLQHQEAGKKSRNQQKGLRRGQGAGRVCYSGNQMERGFMEVRLIPAEKTQMANKNTRIHAYGYQAHSNLTPYNTSHTQDWQESQIIPRWATMWEHTLLMTVSTVMSF